MGLLPSQEEFEYFQNNLAEKYALYGLDVDYYRINVQSYDTVWGEADPDREYLSSQVVKVFFRSMSESIEETMGVIEPVMSVEVTFHKQNFDTQFGGPPIVGDYFVYDGIEYVIQDVTEYSEEQRLYKMPYKLMYLCAVQIKREVEVKQDV